jgi:DNA polymerase III epsilon subunit family exonuclease
MREIVLDTETTGLDPYQGHRLIEVGCIELLNRIPSGQTFHRYINPERDVPAEAFAIHGLSAEFLKDKPRFAEVVEDWVLFIADAPLVAHNASFDLGFLNAELERAGKTAIGRERMVDTLLLARRKHPAGPNRLDDLCARYGIDSSRRVRGLSGADRRPAGAARPGGERQWCGRRPRRRRRHHPAAPDRPGAAALRRRARRASELPPRPRRQGDLARLSAGGVS